MSIGFQLNAEIEDETSFRAALETLAKRFGCSFRGGDGWACVSFCRMGDLLFSFEQPDEASGNTPHLHNMTASQTAVSRADAPVSMTAECVSSLAGAGFHAAAVDLIDALIAETSLTIEVEDETDYYVHRSFERLRSEHFYPWLTTLVDVCGRERENAALSNFCICWDMDRYMPEDIPETVVTPFGRYHIAELVDQAHNEGIEPFAKEFFIWNERGKDGRYYLNTALSALWEDCYFMPGSRSEQDERINRSIIELLEQAARLDPSLALPKQEYEYLCRLENHAPMDLSAAADRRPDYPIGYRRGAVTYRLGNTDIKVSGSYLQEEEDRDTIWYDNREENWHALRVSAFLQKEGKAEFTESLFQAPCLAPTEFKAGEGRGLAAFAGKVQDDGDESAYYQSIAEIICEGQTTFITASYEREEEAEWAMNLFQNIKAYKKIEV